MNNIQDMIDRSSRFDSFKDDYIVSPQRITWNEAGQLTFDHLFGQVALPMNSRAIGHVCNKLGPPPARYIRQCPGELVASNLNHWIKELPYRNPRDWFVRAYSGEARAVMSDKYVAINNTQVLKAAWDMIGSNGGISGYRLVRPWVDPDSLHLRMTVADTNGGNYSIGCYIGNGEVGNYQLQVAPFIQRTSCENSIVFIPDATWKHKHIHITEGEMYAFLKGRIGQALQLAPEMISAVARAEADTIPDLGDVVKTIVKREGLNEETHNNILIGSEGEKTRMGLVNGLSFAAHASSLSQDDQMRLEFLAGDELARDLFQEVEHAETARLI